MSARALSIRRHPNLRLELLHAAAEGRQVELPRQHADDRIIGAVHDNGLSNDLRVAAKAPLEKRVAQHHYAIFARLGFLGRERASQQPPDSEQVEEPGRDRSGFHLLGLVAAGKIEAGIAEEGDPVENAVLVAPFDEVLQASRHALGHQTVERRVGFPHHRQPLRIAKGHGPQKHGVEN
jgi:hypothetical protein